MNPNTDLPTPSRRRFGRREPRPADAAGDSLQSALAELVLLREENARLKAAQHQPPSLGRVLGKARSKIGAGPDHEDMADEAAQLLVEGMVLRESLLEVCHELERALAGAKARLEAPATAAALAPEGGLSGGDA
jgi:hypothetical protein